MQLPSSPTTANTVAYTAAPRLVHLWSIPSSWSTHAPPLTFPNCRLKQPSPSHRHDTPIGLPPAPIIGPPRPTSTLSVYASELLPPPHARANPKSTPPSPVRCRTFPPPRPAATCHHPTATHQLELCSHLSRGRGSSLVPFFLTTVAAVSPFTGDGPCRLWPSSVRWFSLSLYVSVALTC